MRHTLLPLTERIELRREYYIRMAIVACTLLSVAGLIGSAALLPAYMRARNTEEAELNAIAKLRRDRDESGTTIIMNELRADASTLQNIADSVDLPKASNAINNTIILGNGIKLNSFAYSTSGKTALILVRGMAPTRDALLSFKGKLENGISAAKVELPVSELAQSKNISFSMQISYPLP